MTAESRKTTAGNIGKQQAEKKNGRIPSAAADRC
jgi:hypothetical protein